MLNAGRLYLGTSGEDGLAGKVYVTAGLGGMSGAQAKAAVIAGAVCIVAEINEEAATKRHAQGWVDELETDLTRLVERVESARAHGEAVSIAYVGNVVDLLEYLVDHRVAVDLGSDQTSLHLPFSGGYYPVGMSRLEANQLMVQDPDAFKDAVYTSLRRHVTAVNRLVDAGMHFWDYGNAFMLESSRAGADIMKPDGTGFRYPSYVEDIMGPMCFDYGFGPRWVCTSANAADLRVTDALAAEVVRRLADEAPGETRQISG